MTTKTSNALLAAWFVLIAGLIAAIVSFSMKGCSTETAPKDAPVVKIPQRPSIQKPPPGPRHPDRGPSKPTDPRAPAKRFEIKGVVRVPGGDPAPGAHVAVFEPAKPGKPVGPADMTELRLLNQLIYMAPEEWDTPRPLSTWTGGGDRAHAVETELTGADTKDDGTFTISLPTRFGAGPYRLTASKENVGAASMNEVSAGDDVVELMLGPASSVKGLVVTDVDSVPVEGALVIFDNGARRFTAETDSAGRFTADGVSPGFYQLTVAAKGRTPLFETKYKVNAGIPNPITLRMPRGTLLRVKAVVDKDDATGTARKKGELPSDPIADVTIVAFSEGTNTYVIGRTNKEGFVEFPGMPGGTYVLNGKAPEVDGKPTEFVSMGEETVTVDKNQVTQEESVTFEKAVATPIEVVDEDGRPVAGVEFYTVNNDDKYDQVRSMRVGATDSDGKLKYPFEFDGPRSKLFGFKPGFAVLRAEPEDRETGDPLKLVAKKPARVHGVVKTSEGRAVPGALVAIEVSPTDPNASQFEDYSLEITSDADGKYDFPYLPRIEGVTISASGPDGTSQDDKDVEFVAGKSDYEIDLVLDVDDAAPAVVPPKAKPADAQKKPVQQK